MILGPSGCIQVGFALTSGGSGSGGGPDHAMVTVDTPSGGVHPHIWRHNLRDPGTMLPNPPGGAFASGQLWHVPLHPPRSLTPPPYASGGVGGKENHWPQRSASWSRATAAAAASAAAAAAATAAAAGVAPPSRRLVGHMRSHSVCVAMLTPERGGMSRESGSSATNCAELGQQEEQQQQQQEDARIVP